LYNGVKKMHQKNPPMNNSAAGGLKAGLAERQQVPAEPVLAALSMDAGLIPFQITRRLESGIF
jgi:hypothetical protein